MGKKSPCLSCKHKNVYEPLAKCFVCNFSGIKCKNFEMYKPNSQTNADRIRSMSDEELAELLTAVAKHSADKLCESLKTVDVDLSNCDFGILYKAHLSWLKQSAEEGKT